ncbi:MAG TPA: cytochrome c-type biogenesis protein [Solirubrobacteraceae bacterium]|nr:cytochrome c-type biogenesis protein [Solirubrobacteraceae bacterium]
MTRPGTRFAGVAAILLAIWALTAPAALASAPRPQPSLTDIENDVMCTLCHESLAVAQSPQADAERNYIRGLIAKGETKQQILRDMVAQYGPGVLGRPPASGFNLSVYILPPAILVVGIAILAFTLPRWRRRTRAAKSQSPNKPPAFDPAETARLDQELSQFRG